MKFDYYQYDISAHFVGAIILEMGELPDISIFIEHHKTLYRDGYEQGQRDYERYDHHNATPAYAPIQSGVTV